MKRVQALGVAIAVIALLGALALVHARPHEDKLLVYLPAAGKKVWEQLVPLFEKKYGINVIAVYGSSGKLLSQAYLSRKGDLLGSATPPYLEKAVKLGIVYPNTVKYVVCMLPAILVHKNSNIKSLNDLMKPGVKIAMCDSQSCAVGKYFKYMLEKMGIWNKIKKNIVVYTENFAKLVSVLLMGNVDAALGWNVGAYWYPNRLKAINLKPLGPYKPCITLGILKFTNNFNMAKKFEDFITSPLAIKLFAKYGYVSPEVVK